MEGNREAKLRIAAWAVVIAFIGSSSVLTTGANAGQAPSYGKYAAVLSAYVDNEGMVDYKALKADRRKLDSFVVEFAALDVKNYEQWTEKEKIAFWINAYNALTLKAIIDHYPIDASPLTSIFFPESSIRQIPGVWDKLRFPVMGQSVTLDEIEHQTLRKNFKEPRIHMALVCAAMGCPPLRREPYTAERLDTQLDDQARRFLSDPLKFRIDQAEGLVYLSPIFKWFGGDFARAYKTETKAHRQTDVQSAIINFIRKYLDERESEYLAAGGYALLYLSYDWSLNEQKDDKQGEKDR
ncbi:DUF547 domain-containing protein [Candidatus Poribacteria bacterium]|nr:DUF547 domain-containing protein [Candidatus Poribacteria bacterium]